MLSIVRLGLRSKLASNHGGTVARDMAARRWTGGYNT
jgi:hypothetical protein